MKNVFYEVGYAHGLGRNVILLTKNADDIPFDFKHFPHIIYNGEIKTLSSQLKTRLEYFLRKGNDDDNFSEEFRLEFLINGILLKDNILIDLTETIKKLIFDTHVPMKLNIRNASSRLYKQAFIIGLETPADRDYISILNRIRTDTHTILNLSEEISNIYPNAFKTVDFDLYRPILNTIAQYEVPVKLKVFTSFEMRTIGFSLKYETGNPEILDY